ncbi:MAG: DUF2934 domain-containing protein [Candidatus Acidiferrales bacterium]|jgi:hypothetical protein
MSEIFASIPTREQIEQKAYEIYLERGGQDGDDLADWLTAERELRQLAQDSFDGSEDRPRTSDQSGEGAVDDHERAEMERVLQATNRSRAVAAGAGS